MNIGSFLPRALRERIVIGKIKAALVKFGIPEEIVKNIMGGWKTWSSGILGILGGATMILKEVVNGSFDFEVIMAGWVAISAGLAVIGIGDKVEKAGVAAASGNPGVITAPKENPVVEAKPTANVSTGAPLK